MNGNNTQENSPAKSGGGGSMSYGFRLGLIGFLIAWSFSAHGQDLQPVLQGPDAQGKGLEVPMTPDQAGKSGKILPGDVVPSLSMPEPNMKSKVADKPAKQPEKFPGEQWTMLITSGPSRAAGTPAQQELVTFDLDKKTHQVVGGPHVKQLGPDDEHLLAKATVESQGKSKVVAADYEAVYKSIPYSRAEYLANPAYRHEATMEILFGELRPTVIHKQDKPQRVYNQPQIYNAPDVYRPQLPWSWNRPGNAYGFGYGYGPAGYFGARYPYWTPNSTYRIYQTQYGPLFNRYYRPLGF